MEKDVQIQYQSGLALTCTWQGTSRSKFYEELAKEAVLPHVATHCTEN